MAQVREYKDFFGKVHTTAKARNLANDAYTLFSALVDLGIKPPEAGLLVQKMVDGDSLAVDIEVFIRRNRDARGTKNAIQVNVEPIGGVT